MDKRQLPEYFPETGWEEFVHEGLPECRNDLACIRVDALRVEGEEISQIVLGEES